MAVHAKTLQLHYTRVFIFFNQVAGLLKLRFRSIIRLVFNGHGERVGDSM